MPLRILWTNRGLTLVESILSLLLLATVVMAVLFSAHRSLVASHYAYHRLVAQEQLKYQLAWHRLSVEELAIAGPSHFVFETASAKFEGLVRAESEPPGSNLYRLTATARWFERGQPKESQKSMLVMASDD